MRLVCVRCAALGGQTVAAAAQRLDGLVGVFGVELAAQSELVCGPIHLDTRTQEVRVNGAKLELTSFEYKLLEYLMLHAGEVLSKTQITEALYDEDFERDSNVIEVFIGRLRRKLDPEDEYKPIETLRGRGYRLAVARGVPPSA